MVKYWGTANGRVGVPDLIACYRGFFVAFEVKRPGGKATKIQEHEIERIKKCGGRAYVVDRSREVEKALNRIDDEIEIAEIQ